MRLADRYDAFFLDLDGVLYRGDERIESAEPTLEELRRTGKTLVFLTNNSARTPEQVAVKLRGLGIDAKAEEILTSAHATAAMLARGGARGPAYVIGQDGIRSALEDAGIPVVDGAGDRAELVVIGWDGSVTYEALKRAAVLVRGGARLVATNADASYPAPGGELWPGAGAILAAVETASGARASVVGKPHRPLFEVALEKAGTRNALMVGDRVETDIAGAASAGIDSALVLSGAGRPAELLDHDGTPVAVLADVGGLLGVVPPASVRPAKPEEMETIGELTEAPASEPSWGPDGVWVAEGEGLVLATATAEVRDEAAYVRAVATRPELRGAGLGTLVVAAATRDAKKRGASEAWLLTEGAQRFFSGLGFELVDRGSMPGWIDTGPAAGCPVTAVAMRRMLPQ